MSTSINCGDNLCEYLVGLSTTSSNARGVSRRKLTVIVHAANNIHIAGQKHEVVAYMHAARCERLLARQHIYALIAQTTCMQLQLNLSCAIRVHFMLSCDLSDGPCPSYSTPRVNTHLYKRAGRAFKCWVQVAIGRTVYVIYT